MTHFVGLDVSQKATALQPASASSVNQTVKLPRLQSAAS